MTRRKRWLAGGALALVLGLGLVLGAGRAMAEPGRLAGLLPPELADRPVGRILKAAAPKLRALRGELDLTPEQWQSIRAVLRSHDTEIRRVARSLRADHQAVAAAVRAETIDEAAIRAATAKMTESLGDAAVLRAQIRQEIAPLLTDAQRDQLEAFVGDLEQTVDEALEQAE